MRRVLISPCTWELSDARYGKTYNILQHLPEGRFEVEAYVGNVVDHPVNSSVEVHDLESSTKPSYLYHAFRAVHQRVRSGEFDVYHHMNLDYRWFNPVMLSGRTADTPTVIGPAQAGHDIELEEFELIIEWATGREPPAALSRTLFRGVDPLKRHLLNPVRMALFERTLERADRIVVVHEQAREIYEELVPPEKIEVIPLGVNTDLFEFSERRETREVVAIGTLKQRKGYDVLIDAFAEVSSTLPDAELRIFGDGPLEDQLRAQTRELGISDQVTFHGYVDQSELREYLGRAQLFVHPSYSESFSLVRLEAMATGCPAVVSDIPGAEEMVADGVEGYVVPTGDSDAFAERMTEVLSDIDLARELGRNARTKVEDRYAWSEIGAEYAEVWETVA